MGRMEGTRTESPALQKLVSREFADDRVPRRPSWPKSMRSREGGTRTNQARRMSRRRETRSPRATARRRRRPMADSMVVHFPI